MEKMAIAVQIWNEYDSILTGSSALDAVLQAIVDAFIKSPYLLEIKTFLITQVQDQLNYEHIDEILTSMEERFGEIEEDGSNSYLLCNLNPIKTAVHMLMVLSYINERYSMAVLRTEGLEEIILNQGKSILDRLFFPH